MSAAEWPNSGDTKKESAGDILPVPADDDSSRPMSASAFDEADMYRLGKKQEVVRNFGFFATLAFATCYSLTWEYVIISTGAALIDGGFAGAVWEYVWTAAGYFTIVASLAEMASMAPTAGGQYHWTSEFAPRSMQRILSYTSGWTSVIAWQPALSASLYPLVTMIGAMPYYFDGTFSFTNWQTALLLIGFGFTCIPLNTFWRKLLPPFESVALVIHFVGFVAVLVPLWVLAPKASSEDVFLNFVNNGGWSNTGTSLMVGSSAILFTMSGPDSVVHMSEEVKDAAINIPRAMVWSFIMNNAMGFVMMITMCFCIGNLSDNLENSDPFINLFTVGLNAPAGALVLTLVLAILMFVSNATALCTQCRQLWAFARDDGLPFSRWLAKIDKKWQVPLNSIYVSMAINIILALISLGSTLAFNIIISINLVGTLLTYMVSIGCILSARWRGQQLPPARWSLGRLGAPVNAFAFLYAGTMLVFSLFPIQVPVTPDNMNWAIVIVSFVLLVSLTFFVFQGRKRYVGPVAYIEGQRTEDVMQTTEGDEYEAQASHKDGKPAAYA